MSPRRSPKTGLSFNNWIAHQAVGAVGKYKAAVNSAGAGPPYSPKPARALELRRLTARRAVNLKQASNAATMARNMARIERMLKEIANYKARRSHKLVRQPSGSFALARRN